MVHHIHAFTIHVTVLNPSEGCAVCTKLSVHSCQGWIMSGISLGPRVPWSVLDVQLDLCCDLPLLWKMQSDVWGTVNYQTLRVLHITGGDLSVNSTTLKRLVKELSLGHRLLR